MIQSTALHSVPLLLLPPPPLPPPPPLLLLPLLLPCRALPQVTWTKMLLQSGCSHVQVRATAGL